MIEPSYGLSSGLSYLARPGPGPVAVFLHGIGSNAGSFAPLFDILPPSLNVLAWDAPGYGGSAPLPLEWPLAEDYAAKLAALLDGLGHDAVHLVGHSLGSLIAAAFAQRCPNRLLSLTLAASANGYGVPRGGEMPEKVGGRLVDLARLGPAAFAKARSANLVHDPEAHPSLVAKVEAGMAQIDPNGYGQTVRMLASGDLARDMAHVRVRPGFITGAQDQVTPMAQTSNAADAWEAAHGARPTITKIDQAGHAVYLQQPRAFCDALLAHMAEAAACNPKGV